jgi:hypothetical protein
MDNQPTDDAFEFSGRKLRRAATLAVEPLLASFFELAEERLCENPYSLVKGLVSRTLDAAGPAICAMARKAMDGGSRGLGDVSVAPLRLDGAHAALGVLVRPDGGSPYLFVVRVDDPDAAAPEVTDVEVYAAPTGDLAALTEAVRAARPDRGLRLYAASPARPDEDDPSLWTPANIDGSDPCAWVEAFAALRSAAAATGLLPMISERAMEIGLRDYVEIVTDATDALLCEAGPALALMDGGLPSRSAGAVVGGFQARIAARTLQAHVDDLKSLTRRLSEGGHASFAERYECIDGDFSAYCRPAGPADTLCITGDDGAFVVAVEYVSPAERRVAVARCPDAETESTAHRLLAGFHEFHGFRGEFHVVDGPKGAAVTCTERPPFTSAAVSDCYVLGVLLESARRDIEQEPDSLLPQ